MPRVLYIGLALLLTSSAAYAAPGSHFTRLSAGGDQTTSESKPESYSLFEQVRGLLQFRQTVKGVAAAAPTPSEPSAPSGAIKECEEEEVAEKSTKKKEDEKLAKQTGPEPIYLAF